MSFVEKLLTVNALIKKLNLLGYKEPVNEMMDYDLRFVDNGMYYPIGTCYVNHQEKTIDFMMNDGDDRRRIRR